MAKIKIDYEAYTNMFIEYNKLVLDNDLMGCTILQEKFITDLYMNGWNDSYKSFCEILDKKFKI